MKNAVVIPNSHKDLGYRVTRLVSEKLSSLGISAFISRDEFVGEGCDINYYDEFPAFADLIIVIGGDGSIIDGSKYAVKYGIPILGVNLGKVGYLSEVEPNSLDALGQLISGEYTVEERMLIEVVKAPLDNSAMLSDRYAVNDVVISHDSYLGLADIRLEDSFGNSIKYRADGLILSTPQGSTAYSLSAGGPIVAHNVDSILVTPVCAHSFFNRSVLFSADEHIKVTNIGKGVLNISIDGRCLSSLGENEECTIERAAKRIKMLSFSNNRMFSNLFKKMKMLEDMG